MIKLASWKELGPINDHLHKEFGRLEKCQGICDLGVPPIGVPFEVLERIQTLPHQYESECLGDFGLDSDGCIPVGIYDGVEKLHIGHTSHSLWITGSEKHGTRPVSVRMAGDFIIDWRAIRKCQ